MTNAELRADLREKRAAFESLMGAEINAPGTDTLGLDDLPSPVRDYFVALRAAAHLGPDPVEEAFERYREEVIAYEARERTGQAIYWGHMEPIIAARCALDAAIRAEAA